MHREFRSKRQFLKMNSCFVLALTVASLLVADGGVLPSNIKVCPRSAPDYADCIKEAASGALATLAEGSKALGLPKGDPLFIQSIHIAGNGGSVDLEQDFTDLNVHGLKNTQFLNFDYKIDENNCNIKFTTLSPKVELIGKYKMSGKMLLFTLNGHGNSRISTVNLKADHEAKCELFEKDGKKHLKIDTELFAMHPERIEFDLDNLVDGNAELSEQVLKVMNENSMEVFKEVKKDYEATFAEIFKQLANKFFAKVPVEEVFFD